MRLGIAFLRNRRGTSAVEFALIAPFLLLLVAAVMAYGSLFATSLSLQQLAAETARATIGGLNDAEREQLATAHLNANAASYPLLVPGNVAFAFDEAAGGDISTVELSYDITTHPAWSLHQLLPLPKSPLTYTMVVTDGDGATS